MAVRTRTHAPAKAAAPAAPAVNAGDATTKSAAADDSTEVVLTDEEIAQQEADALAEAEAAEAEAAAAAGPSDTVTVILREGELFGLSYLKVHRQFLKGVPQRVPRALAAVLETKTVSVGRIRPGHSATKDFLPRFEIIEDGAPVVRARVRR